MDELDVLVDHMWQNVTAKKGPSACKIKNMRKISDLEEEAKEKRENELEYYDYE